MKTEPENETEERQDGAGLSHGDASNKILPKSSGEAVEAAYVKADAPLDGRGVGRPRGAKNRRSDELRLLQEDRYGVSVGELLTEALFDGFNEHRRDGGKAGDFLEQRARLMSRRLQIPFGEAFKHVKAMADDLMPYVHQKLPTAIEVDGKGIMLAVINPDGGLASPTDGRGLDLRPAQARVIEGEIVGNDAKSDDKSRTDD